MARAVLVECLLVAAAFGDAGIPSQRWEITDLNYHREVKLDQDHPLTVDHHSGNELSPRAYFEAVMEPGRYQRRRSDDESITFECPGRGPATTAPSDIVLAESEDYHMDFYISVYSTSHAIVIVTKSMYSNGISREFYPSTMVKSLDGGATFEFVFREEDNTAFVRLLKSGDGEHFLLTFLSLTFSEDKNAFVVTNENEYGLLVSTNGLATFESADMQERLTVVEFNPEHPMYVLAMDNNDGLHMSSDYGITWKKIIDSVRDFHWGNDPSLPIGTFFYSYQRDESYFELMRVNGGSGPATFVTNAKFFDLWGKHIFAFTGLEYTDAILSVSVDGGTTFRKAIFEDEGTLPTERLYTVVTVDSDTDHVMVVAEDAHPNKKYVALYGDIYYGDLRSNSSTEVKFKKSLSNVALPTVYHDERSELKVSNTIWGSKEGPFVANHVDTYGGKQMSKISFDMGKTWNTMRLKGGTDADVIELVELPNGQTSLVYVGEGHILMTAQLQDAPGKNGIYASNDSGKSWSKEIDGDRRVMSSSDGKMIVAYDTTTATDYIEFTFVNGADLKWSQFMFSSKKEFIVSAMFEDTAPYRKMILITRETEGSLFDTRSIDFDPPCESSTGSVTTAKLSASETVAVVLGVIGIILLLLVLGYVLQKQVCCKKNNAEQATSRGTGEFRRFDDDEVNDVILDELYED